jgi:general secretion pathway protein L
MRRQIIIYYDINVHDQLPTEVSWIVQEQGSPAGPVFHGDLQTASNHALGCRVIVMAPAAMMLLAHVDLPAMNRQRLIKAIPFALEEQLAGDIEDLHFAIGQRDAEGRQGCAVIERDVVAAWLETLKAANIQPDVICSEIYAIPIEQGSWTMLFKDIKGPTLEAILRCDSQEGLVIDYANIMPLLRSFVENTAEDKRPQQLRIIACQDAVRSESISDESDTGEMQPGTDFQATLDQLRELCQSLDMTLDVVRHDEGYLAAAAPHFQETQCINLLQGEFSRKEQFEKLIRPWRAAAAMVLVWLLIQLGGLIAEYRDLAHKDRELRSQMVALFKETFPGSPISTDLQAQMQSELKRLKGSGPSGASLFDLLAKAGPVLNNTDVLTLRGVRYKDDSMDLEIEISDLQALDELKQHLTKQGQLQVEIVSASARGGKVESRLQLKTTQNS